MLLRNLKTALVIALFIPLCLYLHVRNFVSTLHWRWRRRSIEKQTRTQAQWSCKMIDFESTPNSIGPSQDATQEAFDSRNERNQTRFDEMYKRHAEDAYGLALHLTRDRAMADDAFQEAMLRIWRATESFRPQNTRGWIFRIVARECTRVRKAARHGRKYSEKFYARGRRTTDDLSEVQEREGAFATH